VLVKLARQDRQHFRLCNPVAQGSSDAEGRLQEGIREGTYKQAD